MSIIDLLILLYKSGEFRVCIERATIQVVDYILLDHLPLTDPGTFGHPANTHIYTAYSTLIYIWQLYL